MPRDFYVLHHRSSASGSGSDNKISGALRDGAGRKHTCHRRFFQDRIYSEHRDRVQPVFQRRLSSHTHSRCHISCGGGVSFHQA